MTRRTRWAAAFVLVAYVAVLVAFLPARRAETPDVARPPVAGSMPSDPPRRIAAHSPRLEVAADAPAVDRAPVLASGDPRIVVEVVDAGGAALAGAQVGSYDRVEGALLERGTTDATGRVELGGAGGQEASLVARCRGHVARFIRLDAELPAGGAPFRIVLERCAPVVGRARRLDGSPPRRPVRVVVAERIDGAGSNGGATTLAADDLRALSATTDASGSFEIHGLAEGARCSLVPVGAGFAPGESADSPSVDAVAGGPAVDLVLWPLYVLDVRVVGPDGEPLPAGTCVQGFQYGVQLRLSADQALRTHLGSERAATLGGFTAREAADRLGLTVGIAGSEERERIGPFRAVVNVPGYVPASLELWALRADGRESLAQEVRLVRAVGGFGALRIRVEDRDSGFVAALAASRHCATMQPCRVDLRYDAAQPGSESVGAAIPLPLAEVAERGDQPLRLPAGRYRAELRMPLASSERPLWARELVVPDDGVAELVVEVDAWAAIRFELRDGGEPTRPWTRSVTIHLRRAGSRGRTTFRCPGPPYVLGGVPPGAYEYSIGGGDDAEWFPVDLAANAVTTVARTVRGR